MFPMKSPQRKYLPYHELFSLPEFKRTWPEKKLERAPLWCSVDLRDGNQALVNPMNLEQKLEFFKLLLAIGFKEIEIGFPSASEVEFEFTRHLIEHNLIPDDVTPQVLVQSRAHLIERTFEALKGAKRAIVHLYNPTSELQRRVVFNAKKEDVIALALEGVDLINRFAAQTTTEIVLEYSPESFTGTELFFARDICNAVIEAWGPTPERKMIINLPATVEMISPNVYADQIEWMHQNLIRRESVILSLHTHNDRGTGVAATELGILAGGDRVEGTLFGNGERTGNVDIVTLGLNLYTQGVDPQLKLSDLTTMREVYERCTELTVHERHPYAGELVFTAFSGSHQDAINKGMRARIESKKTLWEVPYLPIDPQDLGRSYEAIIRINSQSGKGGVAYIMRSEFGCDLPKDMHPEFSAVIQRLSEKAGSALPAAELWRAFSQEYLEIDVPYRFINFRSAQSLTNSEVYDAVLAVEVSGEPREVVGKGNGPIDACKDALMKLGCAPFTLTNYVQHARSSGSDAESVAYIKVVRSDNAAHGVYGVGINANIEKASIIALMSAVNRVMR
jgi:2-isopropylmalate synthase